VLGREQARTDAIGCADLRLDVADVMVDGPRRDHERLRDLLGPQAAGEQPQHLDLARGQTGRLLPALRDLVACRLQDSVSRAPHELDLGHLNRRLHAALAVVDLLGVGQVSAPAGPAGAQSRRGP
jgi:hypothetical protein